MSTLSQQPPPRKGAKAGYYPDPLGSARSRYWDGSNWTPTLGPQVPEGTARGKSIPPPTKVCPHCHAQAETFETTCPSCGRAYGLSRKAILGIIGASIAVVVLFIGGCAGLIALGIEDREDHEITRAEFEAIEYGSTRDEVERELGDPYDEITFEEEVGDVTCLYYPEEGDHLFSEDDLELCFVAGRLDSKHAE
jgi:Protein of unknown function (DUF2510)